KKRQADGSDAPYVTRAELNDMLAKLADKSEAQQKQATCDLLTALREEIRRVVVDMHIDAPRPAGPSHSASPRQPPAHPGAPDGYPYPQYRGAEADETRNWDEWERNAWVDDERNFADEERNAWVDEERNAWVDDERNAPVED